MSECPVVWAGSLVIASKPARAQIDEFEGGDRCSPLSFGDADTTHYVCVLLVIDTNFRIKRLLANDLLKGWRLSDSGGAR